MRLLIRPSVPNDVDAPHPYPRVVGGRSRGERNQRSRAGPCPHRGQPVGDRRDVAPVRAGDHPVRAARAWLAGRGRERRAGGLPPCLRQGENPACAGGAAQLRLLVRDSLAEDRAPPPESAGLVVVPSTGDAGRPERRAHRHGVARSAAQVLFVARSAGAAASADLRASASRIHDGGGGRRAHGSLDLHGEALAGARHRQAVDLDRSRPGARRSPRGPGEPPMTDMGEGRGRRALGALAELARGSAEPPTPAELDDGLRAVRARIEVGRAARKRTILRLSLMGTAAAALVIVVGFLRGPHAPSPAAPPAMAYRIEGGDVVDGGYLRESGRAGIKLFFAEGTEFIMTPGTRSRLRAVDATGARIAIEHGTASFQVTPAPDHRWQVDVGPFLVTVKGTVFAVSWDAATEKFELRLRHGRVTVSGPVTGGEIALRAGQRLLVDLPRGETLISEQPQAWLDTATDPAPPLAQPTRKPAASKLGEDRGWAGAMAAGDFDRILA